MSLALDATEPAAVTLEDRLWDLAMRLPLAIFYGYFGTMRALGVLTSRPGESVQAILALLPDGATALFMLVVAVMVATRRRRIAGVPGLYAKLVAIGGTFALMLLPVLPRAASVPPAVNLAASVLILTGSLLGAFVASRLGRSFSVLPEARRLVTEGPYRLVRHPLYLVEEIFILGILLPYALPWNLVLLVVHGGLQLERMRLEEQVLTSSFPEYTAYAARTARLLPGIY
jgi:protein-S-isoprenylcysteine O-methyltransferase Ste14